MQSYSLIIGAGAEQVPVIELAQTMGIGVVAVDGNPYAPGLEIADHGFSIDLAKVGNIVDIAKRYDCGCVLPAPIGAFLTTVGSVNDELGLRGISLEAARNCVDKIRFEQVLRSALLPVLETRAAQDREEIESVAAELGFPLVVKPSCGSGSRGLFVASTESGLKKNLEWHLSHRGKIFPFQTTLLQSFVEGIEVGVDAIMIGADYHPLCIRDKELTDLPHRLGYAYLVPTILEDGDQAKVHESIRKAASAVGLRDCFLHADVILDNVGQPWVIELSGRPAGFHIATKMLPLVLGFNPIQKTIEMLSSRNSFSIRDPEPVSAAVLRMFSLPEGNTIECVEGIAAALVFPGVSACECKLKPGDSVVPRQDGHSGFRAGYLLTTASTRQEADRIWHEAANLIHFYVS